MLPISLFIYTVYSAEDNFYKFLLLTNGVCLILDAFYMYYIDKEHVQETREGDVIQVEEQEEEEEEDSSSVSIEYDIDSIVGKRIKVYWRNVKNYECGVVIRKNTGPTQRFGSHVVKYDNEELGEVHERLFKPLLSGKKKKKKNYHVESFEIIDI